MRLQHVEQHITRGSLTLIEPNGHRHSFNHGRPRAIWQLHDSSTLRKILRNPALNFAETYVAGGWSVVENTTLHDLLSVIRLNVPELINRNDRFRRLRERVVSWKSVSRRTRDVSFHYDLDETLFRACLDENLYYSCAYYREPDLSLEQAQQAKCDHIATKLRLVPGQRVLDIGCGWGSLAIDLARRYDVQLTGITLSQEQRRVALQRVAEHGLADRIRIELCDYERHEGVYDRVVSVGMLEHVGLGNLAGYFARIRSLLHAEGIALIHSITSKLPPGPVNPWIARNIFPGGYIPSLSDCAGAIEQSGMTVTDVEVLRNHYAKTLAEWSRRFARTRERFVQSKGESFCRAWEMYLAVSQTAFETGPLVVAQWQLAHDNDRVPVTRDYLYAARPATIDRCTRQTA